MKSLLFSSSMQLFMCLIKKSFFIGAKQMKCACTGYGDIVPHHAKVFFAVYILIAVLTFTFVLGECISIVIVIGRSRRLAAMFQHGLTEELLDLMDISENGDVRLSDDSENCGETDWCMLSEESYQLWYLANVLKLWLPPL